MLNEKIINGLLAVFFILLVLGFLEYQDRFFPGSLPGHAFGLAGTVCIFLAFLYPFRKRVLGKKGKENPLNLHITFGLAGPSLVVIHSAHKVSSLIGVVLFISLLVLVFSGIVGRFLYRKVNKSLREQKRDLDLLKKSIKEKGDAILSCDFSFETVKTTTGEEEGLEEADSIRPEMSRMCRQWLDEAYAIAELEYSIMAFDKTSTIFSRWVKVHYTFAFFLLAMLAVHVLTVSYYGIRWLP